MQSKAIRILETGAPEVMQVGAGVDHVQAHHDLEARKTTGSSILIP